MYGQTLTHNTNGLEQYGLRLIPYGSASFTAALSRLTGRPVDGSLSTVLPFSVIVEHTGARSFISILVRYDLTSFSGEQRFWNNIEYNLHGRGPGQLFGPGRQLFVSPSALVTTYVTMGEAVSDSVGTAGGGPDYGVYVSAGSEFDELSAVLKSQNTVEVSIDSAVFDDGLLVGPDRANTLDRLNAYGGALRDLISEMTVLDATRAPDANISQVLTAKESKNAPPTLGTEYHYGVAQRAYAAPLIAALGRGRDGFRRELENLRALDTLPRVHR